MTSTRHPGVRSRGLALVLAIALPIAADPVPIPAGTRSITVDGVRLRLAPLDPGLTTFATPRLHLPRGTHLVQWDALASRLYVEPAHPAERYRRERDLLDAQPDGGRAALTASLADDPSRFADGTANHLLGRWHHAKGDHDAARRWYGRAVLADPAFAPSHLGLAVLAAVARKPAVAARELALARELDLGGGFGLAAAIDRAIRDHAIEADPAPELASAHYTPGTSEALEELDVRMQRFLRGIAIHFPPGVERAKLENNLGLHLDGAKKPIQARASYALALAELARAPASPARAEVAAVIFANLARSAQASGWAAEAADYAAMRDRARGGR